MALSDWTQNGGSFNIDGDPIHSGSSSLLVQGGSTGTLLWGQSSIDSPQYGKIETYVKFHGPDSDIGLVFDFQDANNYYMLRVVVNPSTNARYINFVLEQVSNGATTTIGTRSTHDYRDYKDDWIGFRVATWNVLGDMLVRPEIDSSTLSGGSDGWEKQYGNDMRVTETQPTGGAVGLYFDIDSSSSLHVDDTKLYY